MLTVYGRANSSNVQKVTWLVGELGLDVIRLDVVERFTALTLTKIKKRNSNRL